MPKKKQITLKITAPALKSLLNMKKTKVGRGKAKKGGALKMRGNGAIRYAGQRPYMGGSVYSVL